MQTGDKREGPFEIRIKGIPHGPAHPPSDRSAIGFDVAKRNEIQESIVTRPESLALLGIRLKRLILADSFNQLLILIPVRDHYTQINIFSW